MSIDIAFDESYMLYSKKEIFFSLPVDTCISKSNEENVDLKVDASS